MLDGLLHSLINIILGCIAISVSVVAISIFVLFLCTKIKSKYKNATKDTEIYHVELIEENYPIIKCTIRMAKERTTNHYYVSEGSIYDKLDQGSLEVNAYVKKHNVNIHDICEGVH